MSKRVIQILAVVVIVCALTLNGFAQSSGPNFSGDGGRVVGGQPVPPFFETTGINSLGRLLRYQKFVEMLELTPQQVTELQKIANETSKTRGEQHQVVLQDYTDVIQNAELRNTKEGRQREAEMQQRMRMVSETSENEMLAKADKVLHPEQRVQLRENIFQLMGGLASTSALPELKLRFLSPDLTDIQKEQIRNLVEERSVEIRLSRERFGDVLRAPGEAGAEARRQNNAEMTKMMALYADRMTSLLTPEQRAKAEKLTAEIPAQRERLGLSPLPRPRAADAGR
jgi:Spy/CpxP family protein refolding chaperone